MNISTPAIFIALFGILHFGHSEVKKDEIDPIATALSKLEKRTNDDSFVIIEALPSERYVQFSTYEDQTVFVDFPISNYQPKDDPYMGIVVSEKVKRTSDIEGYEHTRFISTEEERD
jgi:hypothetical protein